MVVARVHASKHKKCLSFWHKTDTLEPNQSGVGQGLCSVLTLTRHDQSFVCMHGQHLPVSYR
jgi:hypothetical protein